MITGKGFRQSMLSCVGVSVLVALVSFIGVSTAVIFRLYISEGRTGLAVDDLLLIILGSTGGVLLASLFFLYYAKSLGDVEDPKPRREGGGGSGSRNTPSHLRVVSKAQDTAAHVDGDTTS